MPTRSLESCSSAGAPVSRRRRIARLRTRRPGKRVGDQIEAALRDGDRTVRTIALCRAIARRPDPAEAVALLLRAIRDPAVEMRAAGHALLRDYRDRLSRAQRAALAHRARIEDDPFIRSTAEPAGAAFASLTAPLA